MSVDITQEEADNLLAMEKHYYGNERFFLPLHGGKLTIPVHSEDKREKFLLDANRGTIALHRINYQNRARTIVPLIRIDFGTAPHTNPDGEVLECPHMHIYRTGFGDRWAYPLPDSFDKNAPMQDFFQSFMDYCKIVTKPIIELEIFQ